MRNKATKLNPPLSIILAFALIFGLAGYAAAAPLTQVEIAGISTQATEQMLPWGVDRIDAELVHSQNKGRGIKVAILDTGIDLDHPDLQVAGDVTFVPGTTSGDDDNGHGTLVAGIIAALDNSIGTVGIAPEVELYAVKVLDKKGTGTMRAIRRGIEWAIDNDMQVINMSFGVAAKLGHGVRQALKEAYRAGIVIVAAAPAMKALLMAREIPCGLPLNISRLSRWELLMKLIAAIASPAPAIRWNW